MNNADIFLLGVVCGSKVDLSSVLDTTSNKPNNDIFNMGVSSTHHAIDTRQTKAILQSKSNSRLMNSSTNAGAWVLGLRD